MAAGDLEKGEASSSPSPAAAGGSAGFDFLIPAGIAAIIWVSWLCVNFQLQSDASIYGTSIWGVSAYPFALQASTFSVAITLAWLASSRGNSTYALVTSIFNWICVCCWFIYIVPNFSFFQWKSTHPCLASTKPPNYDTDACNSFKAAGIFSLFIVVINFAWFIIYMIKGVSAIQLTGRLKSMFTVLALLNLFGYLLAWAGQLRATDKMGSGVLMDGYYVYIITFMVGICTLLMLAHDIIDNAFHLIWHPLTAAVIWSDVVRYARQTDGKFGPDVARQDDSGKAIAAGFLMMAVAETIASILSIIFKFQGQ